MQHAIRQAPLLLTERRLTAEQLLAGAVLALAVIDASDLQQSEDCRADAHAFLFEPTSMLAFWANVAGLDPELVRQQATRSVRRPRPARRLMMTARRERHPGARREPEAQLDASAAASF